MNPEIDKIIKGLRGMGQMYGPLEAYKTKAIALLFDQLESTIKNLEKVLIIMQKQAIGLLIGFFG